MYVAIQPENLLRHMTVLKEGHLKDFVSIFRTIYRLGKGSEKCYTLSECDQELYDQIFIHM